MKKLLVIALALSAIGGAAAEARNMGTETRSNRDVQVVYMNGHADMGTFDDLVTPDSTTKQQAQAELRKDPGLRQALMRHDVETKNVMAIENAPNGRTTVYVR